MGAGFIITIVLLSALLGLFARQALASEPDVPVADAEAETDSPHSHAM